MLSQHTESHNMLKSIISTSAVETHREALNLSMVGQVDTSRSVQSIKSLVNQ
jgi:hypothetical protein